MLVHSGVSASAAPPAAASRTSASVTGEVGGRIVAGAELDERGPHQLGEHRVELAGAVERVDVVEAADRLVADEDLRHRPAAHRALHHLRPPRRLGRDVDLVEGDALAA